MNRGLRDLDNETSIECSLREEILELINFRRLHGIDESDMKDILRFPSTPLDFFTREVMLGERSVATAEKWNSIESLGRVLVYGDYDADGVCATSIALELCRGKAEGARFFIPHRHDEGYGLHEDSLRKLLPRCDTLIVVDCGTKDYDMIAAAEERGINVFVFDHHEPDGERTSHNAVVNPKADETSFYATNLCAAGVIWLWAWENSIVPESKLLDLVDFAALATIGDCMPLDRLNRAIVREGIRTLSMTKRKGLKTLLDMMGVKTTDSGKYSLSSETLAMKIVPCINAAGRMEHADTAVETLMSIGGGQTSATRLVDLNVLRRRTAGDISEEILPLVESGERVFYGETWPIGVLSGVASQIAGSRRIPCALIAPSDPEKRSLRGTLRVPEGGNAVAILSDISDLLLEWGGHSFAAGFSLSSENLSGVKEALEEKFCSIPESTEEIPAFSMDPSRLTLEIWKEIESYLGPFGQKNPAPIFSVKRSSDERILPLGHDGKHLKIVGDGYTILAFGAGEKEEMIESATEWRYKAAINCWNGEERMQFILER